MIRKISIAVLVIIAALCFAIPAAAETFTSEDGVLSIELPNENWKQIDDLTKWIALSDGRSVITIEHYANGEKLPDISVADNYYVNVYQAVFSTQNEVFIITGSVADAAKIPEIAASIISAKVLKYDTKLAVSRENEISASEISIVPMDKTMYVTTEWLNVRMGCSTDDQTIGGLEYGTPVYVSGSVQRNGADLGWYQVAYANGTGYVSAQFLSDTAPASKEENGSGRENSSDVNYSGSVKTAYDEYGESYTLYEGMDGFWRDRSGTEYDRLSDTEFQVRDGNKRLTTYYPQQAYNNDNEYGTDSYGGGSADVYDEYGESYTLYEGADGFWRDRSGTEYVRLSDTEFQVRDGSKRLTTYYPSQDNSYEDEYDRDFYDGASVTVYDEYGQAYTIYEGTDGYWREGDGTAYVRLSDTEFQLSNGNKILSVY